MSLCELVLNKIFFLGAELLKEFENELVMDAFDELEVSVFIICIGESIKLATELSRSKSGVCLIRKKKN